MMSKRFENPFFSNHIFGSWDLSRMKIKLRHYPKIWFKPTYIQFSDGYEWHYRIDGIGMVYLLKAVRSMDRLNTQEDVDAWCSQWLTTTGIPCQKCDGGVLNAYRGGMKCSDHIRKRGYCDKCGEISEVPTT